jgi:hypothetical protein
VKNEIYGEKTDLHKHPNKATAEKSAFTAKIDSGTHITSIQKDLLRVQFWHGARAYDHFRASDFTLHLKRL